MQWKESLENVISPPKPPIKKVSSLFGEANPRKSFLSEKGILNWNIGSTVSKKGIVEPNIRFKILHKCYINIPKVFRAINMRAEFAVQGGFKLVGNDADVDRLNKWRRRVSLDTILLTIVRNMLKYGNCFVEIVGSGDTTRLQFLPTERMRVIRESVEKDNKTYFTHDIAGYAEMDESNTKPIVEWRGEEMDNIIHFKWNDDGTSAYGVSEIQPALIVLSDKLDSEAVITRILKFHADARIIYQCGREEAPYNDPQMNSFVGTLEERVIGGDAAIAGDIRPIIIQPKSNPEIVELLNHVEQQVDACLNSPAVSLLTGKMDGQASLTMMDAMERDVKTIQDSLFAPFEMQVFPRVLNKKDSPLIKPKPMNIETFLRLSRTLRQLVGKKKERPILTINEARKELGYSDIDETELEKMLEIEQGSEEKDEYRETTGSDGEEIDSDR